MPERDISQKHKFISVVLAIVYIVSVQIFAAPSPVFRFLIPVLVIYLGVVLLYARYYLGRRGLDVKWSLLRLFLFMGGVVGLYFFIPGVFGRGLYLLVASGAIYIALSNVGNVGEQLLFNETLVAVFCSILVLIGLYNYTGISSSMFTILIFGYFTLLSRTSFELIPHDKSTKWLFALIAGLSGAQIFWALSALPLHFSAMGVLLFNCYYAIWSLMYYYLYNHLTVRKVQFHIGLALLLSLIISAVTPWKII